MVAVASNDGDIPNAQAAAWKIAGIYVPTDRYETLSPFQAVRWKADQPEVMLDDEWFRLFSIDGVSIADILAFSRSRFVDDHRKRFEVDLVEVLTLMKHPPGDSVTLVVEALNTSETQKLENVLMTAENRQRIKEAAAATKPVEVEEQ